MTGSSLFPAIPSFSGLSARILPLLAESSPSEGWNTLEAVVMCLQKLAKNVENDWAQSALAGIEAENDIGVYLTTVLVTCGSSLNISVLDSRELAASIWTILKTLLFMTVMLSQSILSTITYSRPVSSTASPPEPEGSATHVPTHSSLALSTLRTLSHLSFVISKFGGVTSTSGVGFAELKRVFYSALDVLSADVEASETFVRSLNADGLSIPRSCPDQFAHFPVPSFGKFQHRGSYAKPSQTCSTNIQPRVHRATRPLTLPRYCRKRCLPPVPSVCLHHPTFSTLFMTALLHFSHLDDASHRETYESAHSVILAVFAAHAHAQLDSTIVAGVKGKGPSQATFVEKIVPFYVHSLLEVRSCHVTIIVGC